MRAELEAMRGTAVAEIAVLAQLAISRVFGAPACVAMFHVSHTTIFETPHYQ